MMFFESSMQTSINIQYVKTQNSLVTTLEKKTANADRFFWVIELFFTTINRVVHVVRPETEKSIKLETINQ